MKKKFKYYRLVGIGLILTAALLLILPAKEKQQAAFDYVDLPPLDDYQKDSHAKMESVLYRLAKVYASAGLGEAKEFAGKRGVEMDGDSIRVVLEARAFENSAEETKLAAKIVRALIVNSGGKIETSYRQSIQGYVPLAAVLDLAEVEAVRYIRRPGKLNLLETSEGVLATGANRWQSLSPYHTTGDVKVCVLDAGFMNYQYLLGTELPASVITKSFRSDGDLYAGIDHGTACAEIVHDMAPGARMWLVNIETDVQLQNAVNYIVGEGVDVISCSLGSFWSGAGDGTGPACELVKYAYDQGIAWAAAAGNSANDHWQGNFQDTDSDDWHNFTASDEILSFYLPAYTPNVICLKWNDWGTWNGSSYSGSDQDYDLYLYFYDGANWQYVDHSDNVQNGTQWPVELMYGWYASSAAYWGIAIHKADASKNVKFDLFVLMHSGSVEYANPAGSIASPADSPYAIAVGAVAWSDFSYHTYSSRGPTLDGRIKPDLCAPSGVSTVSYGSYGFYGTSAATPHVAGALTLLKIKTPFDLAQIKSILETRAQDLGTAGKDNQFGVGRLKLD